MKQKHSQAEKAAAKDFYIKELSTYRTAFKFEQIPNEIRTPSNSGGLNVETKSYYKQRGLVTSRNSG